MISRDDAKKLAVQYAAYCEATTASLRDPDDDRAQNALLVWGDMLHRTQERTGVTVQVVPARHRYERA